MTGAELRRRRLNLGLTQEAMAKELRTHPRNVQRMEELADREIPGWHAALAEYLSRYGPLVGCSPLSTDVIIQFNQAGRQEAQMSEVLDKELRHFEVTKEELLKHYRGQFVLIKDEELNGAYTTEAEAYAAGVEAFGNQPFLIKKVEEREEVEHIPALSLGILHARF